MNEQLSLLSFLPWNKSLKGREKEWLIANGYHNWYDQRPTPGLYEWCNINNPNETHYLNVTEQGIYLGSLDFNPVWWREISPEKKDEYLNKIAPKEIPLGFGGYTVWIIKYEWMPNRWLAVWNKRGNCLEFYDKEHAEYFLQNHPEAVNGHDYKIVQRTYSPETADQMEYGNKSNIWEYE